jgi:hypothetical protein
MTRSSLRSFAVVMLGLMLFSGLAAPVAVTAQGNSANAKLCQKGGWQDLQTDQGEPFASQDACVSYAAQGGTLEAIPVVDPEISG